MSQYNGPGWEGSFIYKPDKVGSWAEARYTSVHQMAQGYLIMKERLICYRSGVSAIDYATMFESMADPNDFSTGGDHGCLHEWVEVEYIEGMLDTVENIVGEKQMAAWRAVQLKELSYRQAAKKAGYSENSFSHVRRIVSKIDAILEEILYKQDKWRG